MMIGWYIKKSYTRNLQNEAKTTGYTDEETSKRFLKKMMSATQDVD